MEGHHDHIKPNEQELLIRLRQGDGDAFATLFYLYKDQLYGMLLSITKSPARAEDLFQDVFVKVWQHREKLEGVEHFKAYVFRIAYHMAIDELRKWGKEQTAMKGLMGIGEEKAGDDPYERLAGKEAQERMRAAINKLPPQQQKVYRLSKEKGLRHEEIANQLNVSVSTIKNHLMQALANLRRFFF